MRNKAKKEKNLGFGFSLAITGKSFIAQHLYANQCNGGKNSVSSGFCG
ncbi:MAG: hypothetical protein KAG56_10900 [Sulfurovaceae bacterium]|nr:hypothetical protein [Sulfurovaceae bacterium]